MCVGFTNGYEDFDARSWPLALQSMVPGSAISFNRISGYHFAIFLGSATTYKSDSTTASEPIPLLCHLFTDDDGPAVASISSSAGSGASVRLSDLRDVVQNSTIRVYRCSCTTGKRAQVVTKCVARVGEASRSAPLTHASENFVRQVITGQDVSYQTMWTVLAPFVQLPRMAIGSLISAAQSGGAQQQQQASNSLSRHSCLILNNTGMERLEIDIFSGGLAATLRR